MKRSRDGREGGSEATAVGWLIVAAMIGDVASPCAAQANRTTAVDPDQFPLPLHRAMEVEDIDRQGRQLRDQIAEAETRYAKVRELAERKVVPVVELKREAAELDHLKARAVELQAFRALKLHEREVLATGINNEAITYDLLLALLKAQEEMARVEREFRRYEYLQTAALRKAGAVSDEELARAKSNYDLASANLNMSRARQEQVALELAVRKGEQAFEANAFRDLKLRAVRARLVYDELAAEAIRRRLDLARERARRGLTANAELEALSAALKQAQAEVEADRTELERFANETIEPPPPLNPPTNPAAPVPPRTQPRSGPDTATHVSSSPRLNG